MDGERKRVRNNCCCTFNLYSNWASVRACGIELCSDAQINVHVEELEQHG